MITIVQIARIAAVMALLGFAAAIATPKGRLPLVLRGVSKTLGRPITEAKGERVPMGKRLLAFVLVLLAILVALV